jgi:membrane-associated protease RseP (regulator of RpoE activity)
MQACYERNKQAYVSIDGYPAIAITPTLAIAPNIGKAPKTYIKYDPFINAYILSSKTPLSPVPQNEERALEKDSWLTPIQADGKMEIGSLVGLGSSLENYDYISVNAPKGTIVTGGCCDMYGVGMGNGRFIGNRYLEHIVAHESVYYGDIGADFVWKNNIVEVINVDPFFGNGLRIGDQITHIDNNPISSLRELNEAILFAPNGSVVTLSLKRGGKTQNLSINIKPRPIVSMATLSYLEPLGMHFDSKLILRRVDVDSKASSQGLEVGDRLIQIGNVALKTPAQLRAFLPTLQRDKTHHMLFERNQFQFFITLDLPKR